MFIVIEGGDGAGKATQARILAERLRAQLYSFPQYDTPIGQMILRHLKGETELREHSETVEMFGKPLKITCSSADDPLAFQCLMVADKLMAARSILSDLRADRPVVCDRWIPSAICYGAADGVPVPLLHDIHAALPQADLNIFLDVAPEEALRRRPEARDRYERDRTKQEAVRSHYEALWIAGAALHGTGGPSYVKVDGDGNRDGNGDGPIATVAERVWKAVQAKFGVIEGGKRK